MPHLTIAKMDNVQEAVKVVEVARRRWGQYNGTRSVKINSLTLVKGTGERWVDLESAILTGESAK